MAPRPRWAISLLLVSCLLMVGCNLSRPNWFNPGTIEQQQQRATIHDPYGDNDLGPEIVGGRPRDFERPAAEPARTQPWKYWYGN